MNNPVKVASRGFALTRLASAVLLGLGLASAPLAGLSLAAPIIGGPAVTPDMAACKARKLTIRLTVTRVKGARGTIIVDLHGDKPQDFLKENIGRAIAPAKAGEVHLCMTVDHPGWYAIALYHDKNDNRKLDKNWLGIPRERIGISNNPRFHFRVPRYKEAAFEVPEEGVDLIIRMRSAL